MKRRTFLSLTTGTAAAAALPLPALPAAPAAVPRTVGAAQYAWAVAISRAQDRVSAGMLQSQLQITGAEAQALMARLSARGVITGANAAGVARATEPLFRGRFLPPVQAGGAAAQPARRSLRGHLRDLLDFRHDGSRPQQAEADQDRSDPDGTPQAEV